MEKACELAPIGPVVFIDTAGVDDVGELGAARVERSKTVLEWVDVALIIASAAGLEADDRDLVATARRLGTAAVLVLNKAGVTPPSEAVLAEAKALGIPVVVTDARERTGIDALREAIIRLVEDDTEPDRPLAGDLAHAGDTAVLVTPIDSGAPKGRLILPQVQAIRELLDAHAKVVVVQQDRVAEAIAELKRPPAFVMTDLQAIDDVVRQTPESIPLTTFSPHRARRGHRGPRSAQGRRPRAHLRDVQPPPAEGRHRPAQDPALVA